MPQVKASIKFILRFIADNFTLTKILFIYYKMKQHFVVKIPNQKSGKMTGFLLSSRTSPQAGVAISCITGGLPRRIAKLCSSQ